MADDGWIPAGRRARKHQAIQQQQQQQSSKVSEARRRGIPRPPRVCIQFKAGECRFGSRCRFSHEDSPPQPAKQQKQQAGPSAPHPQQQHREQQQQQEQHQSPPHAEVSSGEPSPQRPAPLRQEAAVASAVLPFNPPEPSAAAAPAVATVSPPDPKQIQSRIVGVLLRHEARLRPQRYGDPSFPSGSAANVENGAPLAIRGFVNMGNTCFLNSVLQIVVGIPEMRRLWRDLTIIVQPAASPAASFAKAERSPLPTLPDFPLLLEVIRFAHALDEGLPPASAASGAAGEVVQPPAVHVPQQQQQHHSGTAADSKRRRRRRKGGCAGASSSPASSSAASSSVSPPTVASASHRRLPAIAPHLPEIRARFQRHQFGAQEDAVEFLEWLLGALSEEMERAIRALPLKDRRELLSVQVGPAEAAAIIAAQEAAAAMSSGGGDSGWVEVGAGSKSRSRVVEDADFEVSTPVSRLFGGRLRLQARKRGGLGNTVSMQPFFALHLDLLRPNPKASGRGRGGMSEVASLEEALDFHMARQEVEGFRSRDRELVRLTQQTTVERLPPYLLLHLKRFQVSADGSVVEKLHHAVDFQPNLSLPRGLVFGSAVEDPRFQLVGVVVHHGDSVRRGHYTTYLRTGGLDNSPERQDSQQQLAAWWHLDDDQISQVSQREVLRQPAYLLVYRRRPVARPESSGVRAGEDDDNCGRQ